MRHERADGGQLSLCRGKLERMAESDGWYNGFSWKEREAKLRALKRKIAAGDIQPAGGCCALCGDPAVPLEYHDEDYGQPYLWTEPAMYALCRNGHRDKLHKRFSRPSAWQAFLAHVRRGGYARDLKDAAIRKEVQACQLAIEQQQPFDLRPLRPYARIPGEEWFATLHLDPASLMDRNARPRAG